MDGRKSELAQRIGRAISDQRRRVGLTQAEAAARAGITPSTLSNWETGNLVRKPDKWHYLEPAIGWAAGAWEAFERGEPPRQLDDATPQEKSGDVVEMRRLPRRMQQELGPDRDVVTHSTVTFGSPGQELRLMMVLTSKHGDRDVDLEELRQYADEIAATMERLRRLGVDVDDNDGVNGTEPSGGGEPNAAG